MTLKIGFYQPMGYYASDTTDNDIRYFHKDGTFQFGITNTDLGYWKTEEELKSCVISHGHDFD